MRSRTASLMSRSCSGGNLPERATNSRTSRPSGRPAPCSSTVGHEAGEVLRGHRLLLLASTQPTHDVEHVQEQLARDRAPTLRQPAATDRRPGDRRDLGFEIRILTRAHTTGDADQAGDHRLQRQSGPRSHRRWPEPSGHAAPRLRRPDRHPSRCGPGPHPETAHRGATGHQPNAVRRPRHPGSRHGAPVGIQIGEQRKAHRNTPLVETGY